MFQELIALIGAQNSSTVTTDSGIAAYCMKGIRLPRGFLLRSESEAIHGSVIASKILDRAVIRPSTVKKPPMTRPGTMYWIAPFSISTCVGR